MRRRTYPLGTLLLIVGCAASEMPRESDFAETAARKAVASATVAPTADAPEESAGVAAPSSATAAPIPVPARKIIYTATIALLVEDMGRAEAAIPKLVQSAGGYISAQDLSGSSGAQRHGSWTLRVPVDRFDAFLDEIAALGEVQRSRRDSKDVTEQFFDTEARLSNKKVAEQRLVKLLEERTGKLEDVLTVEKELSRVRGEAEQLEGSLRLLANLTSLTTVNLTVTERKDYIPPQAPTFGTTIGRTFEGSVAALVALGKAVVLVVVALVPWIPLVLALGLIAWALGRRWDRAGRRARLAPPGDAFVPEL